MPSLRKKLKKNEKEKLKPGHVIKMQAVAVLSSSVKGIVRFIEQDKGVMIYVDVSGLRKNGRHGFHVHEAGVRSLGMLKRIFS